MIYDHWNSDTDFESNWCNNKEDSLVSIKNLFILIKTNKLIIFADDTTVLIKD